MEKVIVQIDWYTKIILTLIAVLLAGLLAKPYVAPQPVGAYNGEHPVPVEVTNWAVPVEVTNSVEAAVINYPIPVEVTNLVETEITNISRSELPISVRVTNFP